MTSIELKYKLFKIIDGIDDTDILSEIKNLLDLNLTKGGYDFWDDLTPDNRNEINTALSECSATGKMIPNSAVFEDYKK
jgi:hypothetical protein